MQTVTWNGELPVFSVERDPIGAKPDELLEPLSGVKPIDEPKEPPRQPIKPRVDPDPHQHEGEPAWYRKRWVQVSIAGGASAVRQYLAAGMLDELYLHIVPVVLASGERLIENVGDPRLEPVTVIASPAVTHVKYRIVR